MKLIAKIIIFSLCIANVHAELLIIKRVQPQAAASSSSSSKASQSLIAPLDENDEPNYPAIAQVLLNYQWPMVIANPNLTATEQDELLTANVPNAEENFIRRKLQEINPAYDVVFIPTCLYELFIIDIANKEEKDPLQNILKSLDWIIYRGIYIINEINGNGPLHNPWQDVYNFFNSRNSTFYNDAFFYCNNRIIQDLLHSYQIVEPVSTGIEMSNVIESLISKIGHHLSLKLFNNNKDKLPYDFFYKQIAHLENSIHYHQALAQVISLEYEMRKLNKGLLLRGTNKIKLQRSYLEELPIIGSTLKERKLFENMQKSYKNKATLPYSIAFGNSLFAGFVHDETACVASYFKEMSDHGYGLSINKKEYIQNQPSSLFFISPLAPIAALFATGELFHSRTKIVIDKNIKEQISQGLLIPLQMITDPDHIITTINDPLVNAELFSNYLADNMYILNVGIKAITPCDLTGEEQAIYDQKRIEESDQLRANQAKATDYYKATRKLAQHLPKATVNYRKKLDDKKLMNDTQKFMDSID